MLGHPTSVSTLAHFQRVGKHITDSWNNGVMIGAKCFIFPELQRRHGVCNHGITGQTGWLVSPWWTKTLLPGETRVLCYETWNLNLKYVSPRRSRFSNVLKPSPPPPNLSCGDSQWPQNFQVLPTFGSLFLAICDGSTVLRDVFFFQPLSLIIRVYLL